jgi:hypothetical protein
MDLVRYLDNTAEQLTGSDGVAASDILKHDAAMRAELGCAERLLDAMFLALDGVPFVEATPGKRYKRFLGGAERIQRLKAELTALKQEKLVENAPCFLCGYNGPAYAHPESHPCAAAYRDAQEGRL